jgi:hypothetical protein
VPYRWTEPIIWQVNAKPKVPLEKRLGELHDRLGIVEIQAVAVAAEVFAKIWVVAPKLRKIDF